MTFYTSTPADVVLKSIAINATLKNSCWFFFFLGGGGTLTKGE